MHFLHINSWIFILILDSPPINRILFFKNSFQPKKKAPKKKHSSKPSNFVTLIFVSQLCLNKFSSFLFILFKSPSQKQHLYPSLIAIQTKHKNKIKHLISIIPEISLNASVSKAIKTRMKKLRYVMQLKDFTVLALFKRYCRLKDKNSFEFKARIMICLI